MALTLIDADGVRYDPTVPGGPYTGIDNDGQRFQFYSGSTQRKQLRVGLVGGSLAAYNTNTGATSEDQDTRGIVTWANMLMGTPLQIIRNAGVAGRTTAETLANLGTDILTADIGMCFVLNGGNDIINGVALSTIQSNFYEIYNRLLDRGIQPVGITITPGGATVPSAAVTKQMALNDWLREYESRYGGAKIFDAYSYAVAPVAGTDTWFTGGSVDGIHPVSPGSFAIGTPFAAWLQSILGIATKKGTVTSLVDGWTNSGAASSRGINLYDSVSLGQGTSGTAVNVTSTNPCSFSGTAPGGSASDRINVYADSLGTAGMICTNSIAADALGYGNYHQMVVTITAAGQWVGDVFQTVASKATNGKWYAAEAVIDVVTGTTRPSEVCVMVSMAADTSIRASTGFETVASTSSIGADISRMRVCSPRRQYATGYGVLQIIVRFKFRTTGTCTLRVRQGALREYSTQFDD